MDALALLEEAGRVEPPDDQVVDAAVSAVLEAVRREQRDQAEPHKHHLLPRGRRRVVRAVAIGVPVAAAIAIVSIVVTGFGPGTQAAFAGWSATPTAPSPGQVAAANRTCIADANQSSYDRQHMVLRTGTHPTTTIPSPFGTPEGSWTPVVDDTRGPYTLVVMTLASTIGTQEAACLTGPGRLADHPTMTTASGTSTPQPLPDAIGTTGWGRGGTGADTVLLGTVGKDVAAVTLTLDDGTKVGATVANGSYAAWWPGTANPASAVASTAAGSTTTHSFTS